MLVFLLVVLAAAGVDLWTKQAVFAWLKADPTLDPTAEQIRSRFGPDMDSDEMLARLHLREKLTRKIFPGLRFTLKLNPGVAFGMPMPRWAVATATCVTILIVLIIFLTSPVRMWGLHLALAMILAGALGNLYDRLFACVEIPSAETICYHVRDFVDFSDLEIAGKAVYPWVFNVADVYLVVGVGVLMLHWLANARREAKRKTGSADQ